MKIDVNTKARLTFSMFLLVSIVAGALWYVHFVSQNATYQIYTEGSVSGLIADAPIEFHGVDVGKVKSIKLVNPHSVRILLSIDKAAPITSASVATITARGLATRGFTGYVYISLDDVGIDSRPLTTRSGEPFPIIRTAQSKVITLDMSINQLKDNVQVITDLLQSLLDKKTIMSLQQSVDSLQHLTKLLANNTQKLNSIVANAERASHRFEPLLKSSHDTMRALQMQIVPEAHKALIDLDSLSTTFTGVAMKINRDPSILIRGTTPPAPGPGETK